MWWRLPIRNHSNILIIKHIWSNSKHVYKILNVNIFRNIWLSFMQNDLNISSVTLCVGIQPLTHRTYHRKRMCWPYCLTNMSIEIVPRVEASDFLWHIFHPHRPTLHRRFWKKNIKTVVQNWMEKLLSCVFLFYHRFVLQTTFPRPEKNNRYCLARHIKDVI